MPPHAIAVVIDEEVAAMRVEIAEEVDQRVTCQHCTWPLAEL